MFTKGNKSIFRQNKFLLKNANILAAEYIIRFNNHKEIQEHINKMLSSLVVNESSMPMIDLYLDVKNIVTKELMKKMNVDKIVEDSLKQAAKLMNERVEKYINNKSKLL